MYTRLGTSADIQAKIKDAQAQPASCGVKVLKTGSMVVIRVGGAIAMRALRKHGTAWLCMYNDAFYPRPAY